MRMPSSRPEPFAAEATRTLALTARLIPKYPTAAEKIAPSTKKPERPKRIPAVSAGRAINRKKTMTTKTDKVLNCRAR